ncbi:MAG: type II toxin-antitoxin system HipA family toxin [Deltaproteobacteria bacterium]|nr:type II toxin-antitoxin system HipA family toxin [Deltaproteobacteria bacterium]
MKRLNVFLYVEKEHEILVGELAEREHRLYFQYHADFLKRSLWLSPYKLPLSADLYEHKDRNFGPIFGLFDDSLPDGWGLMLMDRFLQNHGFSIEKLSILDRLSFLGRNTMGALTYRPEMEVKTQDATHFDLYNLYSQSQEILNGKTQTVLPELMKAGGSPGGARPKILVGIFKDRLISGEGTLPKGFEPWMIKFNANNDFIDSGPVEYAYSLMAVECGIKMPETRLFETERGDFFFGVKRFDRDGVKRFHSHTFGNLIQSNFRIPACDYEMLFRIISNLTKNQSDLIRGFRQMVFNIFSNNRDDHVKNFAFIMNFEGEWSLSPAYDLTYSEGPGGEHSMAVGGEGVSPTKKNIFSLGIKAGLKKREIILILEEIRQVISEWKKYAKVAGVCKKSLKTIQNKIDINLSIK